MYLKTSALALFFISFATVVSAGGVVARLPEEVTLRKDGNVVAMRSGLIWKGHTNTHGEEGKFSVESISNVDIFNGEVTATFRINAVKEPFEMNTTLTPLRPVGADDNCAVESSDDRNVYIHCTFQLHKLNTDEAKIDPKQYFPLEK